MKKFLQWFYNHALRERRLERLTNILVPYIPDSGEILDLGCGDGALSNALKARKPNVQFTGLDIKATANSDVPISVYNGVVIPYPSQYFDYVMMITMLHHTDDYLPVLHEASRVARKGLIILDHQYSGYIEWLTLAIIDFPGNVPFGVHTPFNFLTRLKWQKLFDKLKYTEVKHNNRLYLFGKMADCIFGRRMHFISVLERQ